MSKNPLGRLSSCFAEIYDPRVEGRCDHKLIAILYLLNSSGLSR